jgi:hypothetical protein
MRGKQIFLYDYVLYNQASSDSTRMSKRTFDHSYGWSPRLRLRRPTSVLVIKCSLVLKIAILKKNQLTFSELEKQFISLQYVEEVNILLCNQAPFVKKKLNWRILSSLCVEHLRTIHRTVNVVAD